LIDADALVEQLREANRQCNNDIVKCCIGLVQTQPTAYNVDAVLAELEAMEEKAIRVKNITVSSYACGMMHKAIDIVKRGGVE
jgi:methylthioribose-1-phosphate isomerase